MNFTNPNSIFWRTIRLQLENSNQSIDEYPTFIHVRSVFNDEWYNFIIPIQEAQYFEWDKAESIINSESLSGKTVSLCIHKELNEAYKDALTAKGFEEAGSEVYMHRKSMQEEIQDDRTFESVEDSNYEILLEMSSSCFPDWDNNEEFTKFFHDLTGKETKNSYHEYLEKDGDQYVAYGCAVLSKEENLAYLHNTGTLEEHRRKGYFTSLIQFLSNLALNMGMQDLVAIVEEGEGSYQALLKMGFEEKELFILYTKEG